MEKKKRVLFYLPMLGQGGIERVVYRVVDKLSSEVDFCIAGQVQQGDSILNVNSLAGKSVLLNAPNINMAGNRYVLYHMYKMKQYVDSYHPDIIFSFWHLPNLVTGLLLSLYRVSRRPKWVMSVHGESPGFDEKRGCKGKFLSSLLKRVACISSSRLTVAPSLVPKCQEYYGQDFDLFFNPAVDDSMLALAKEDPGHPWLLPGNKTIISIGRVDHNKDYQTLIKAFELVRKEVVDSKLIILGDGPLRSEMLDLVASRGLADCVDLVGYVPNPYSYLSRCKMFVLTSISEASPMVLAEAMFFEKPIVCSDFYTAPDFIDDGVNGLLAKRQDIEGIAGKILALFADEGFSLRIVENAKKMVIERHGVPNATKRYLDLISRL